MRTRSLFLKRTLPYQFDSKWETAILGSINQFHQSNLERVEDYISSTLAGISKGYYDVGQDQINQAAEHLQRAWSDLVNSQDYISAANHILEAKTLLGPSGGVVESIGPDDFISPLGLVTRGPIILSRGFVKYGGGIFLGQVLTIQERTAIAKIIFRSSESKITVLGSSKTYLDYGRKIGANVLDIHPDIWKKIPNDARMMLNREFLDQAVKRGDQILLSDVVKSVESLPEGFFRAELEYLINERKWFMLSPTGKELIRIRK